MASKTYSATAGNIVYSVHIFSETNASTYVQALNPATGQGWQKKRDTQLFFGTRANSKAMVAWMTQVRTARQS